MLCASDGTLWIGSSDGLIHRTGDRELRMTDADGLADNSILTPDRESQRRRLRRHEKRLQPDSRARDRKLHAARWSVAEHGVRAVRRPRRQPVGRHQTRPEPVPRRHHHSRTRRAKVCRPTTPARCSQDRHGTVWVGTLGGGLGRFDGHRFSTLTTRDGLASNTIYALAEGRDGDIWVGHRGRTQPTASRTGHRHLDDAPGSSRQRRPRRSIAIATTRSGLPPQADLRSFATAAMQRRPQSSRHTAESILAFGDDRNGRLYRRARQRLSAAAPRGRGLRGQRRSALDRHARRGPETRRQRTRLQLLGARRAVRRRDLRDRRGRSTDVCGWRAARASSRSTGTTFGSSPRD